MKKSKYSQWTLSFAGLGGLVGISLAQIGDFDWAAVIGGLSAALLFFVINVIYVWRKSDETPEFDERTITNMRTFYFYAFIVFISSLFIGLGILLAMGVEVISTLTLFLVVIGYFVVCGIIALVISRR